tara:strand:+ start:203 stop:793 length:591 start_codon:yes stop_codon:yes gene_type:complete
VDAKQQAYAHSSLSLACYFPPFIKALGSLMKILRICLFLWIFALPQIANSNSYERYEDLVKGKKPSEAWILGANKLVEYMYVNSESACRFMSEMSSSIKLEGMVNFFKAQNGFDTLGLGEDILPPEFAYLACIKGRLFANKPPESMRSQKVTDRNILDEQVVGNVAIVKAKFVDGSVKSMQLFFENEVWKVNGIIP